MDMERAERAVRELLTALGEDPDREGLLDTPHRVAKAWREMLSGRDVRGEDVLKRSFAANYDEVVAMESEGRGLGPRRHSTG